MPPLYANLNEADPESIRLFSQAKERQKAGQYRAAVDLLKQALDQEKQQSDPSPDFLVLAFSRLNLCYFVIGDYEQAIRFASRALEISQSRNDFDSVAQSLHSIAYAYRAWGKYPKALQYFGRALEVDIQLNSPGQVARDLAGIGSIYHLWGDYDEALKFFQQALDINRKFGFEANLAENFNAIGMVYEARGDCEAALTHFQQALDLDIKLNRTAALSAIYSNIGLCYRALGRYRQALSHFQNALERDRQIGKRRAIARDLSHIGLLFYDWGSYNKALSHFRRALDIGRSIGKSDFVGDSLNNIGMVYLAVQDYEAAIVYLKQALTIHRNLGLSGAVARDTGNLGVAYLNLERFQEAFIAFGEALEINEKLGRDAAISRDLNNMGMVLTRLDLHDDALKFFSDALAIDSKLGLKAEVAGKHNNIGMSHYYQARYDQAIYHFKAAIELKEQLRLIARDDLRRDYLASQLHTYEWLVDAYLKKGEFDHMYNAMEMSRAKLLAEQIAESEEHIPQLTAADIQKGLDAETAVLMYAGIPEPPFFQLVITRDAIVGMELDINALVTPPLELRFGPLPGTPNTVKRGIRPTARIEMGPRDPQITENPFDGVVHLYRRFLLNALAEPDRGVRVTGTAKENNPDLARELGMRLYRLLVKPAAELIGDKKQLIIVPDGILAYLPFETLIDEQERYLAETFTIGYVQSLTVMDLIKKRTYARGRKPILALGGATYEPVSIAAEPVQSGGDLRRLNEDVDAAIAKNESVRSIYAALQMASWQSLPGTLAEVTEIAGIVPDAETFTADQVSENQVKTLSTQGKLKNYKVIHFATHGLVVPAIPALSALVLSQYNRETGSEDGYLRMGEIARLELAADFVNLSACETGLGKIYGGEGVVGLPQAFLLAGANGLSVSLWQVADDSTTKFMTGLYKHVEHTGAGYKEALAHMKRRFINGEFGENYRRPYFWAPFVYYGKP